MLKTCNAHHPLDAGSWMNTYLRVKCDVCAKCTTDVAFNCPTCVIDVCTPCASKYGDRVGFALHLASGGRLGLLADGCDHIERDAGHVLFHEFHRFYNTDVYREKLSARIAALERVLAETQEELDDHRQELAESNARRGNQTLLGSPGSLSAAE